MPAKSTGATPQRRKRVSKKQAVPAAAAAKTVAKRASGMSDNHKAALAAGREEGRAVRNYLEVINRPKRPGRKRTADSIARQIAEVEGKLAAADAGQKLLLTQQRRDLNAELEQLKKESSEDLVALEKAFIKVAASYSDRKGISYAAWRDNGVSAVVLRQAGIGRGRS